MLCIVFSEMFALIHQPVRPRRCEMEANKTTESCVSIRDFVSHLINSFLSVAIECLYGNYPAQNTKRTS
jgi:hypothetical protein